MSLALAEPSVNDIICESHAGQFVDSSYLLSTVPRAAVNLVRDVFRSAYTSTDWMLPGLRRRAWKPKLLLPVHSPHVTVVQLRQVHPSCLITAPGRAGNRCLWTSDYCRNYPFRMWSSICRPGLIFQPWWHSCQTSETRDSCTLSAPHAATCTRRAKQKQLAKDLL